MTIYTPYGYRYNWLRGKPRGVRLDRREEKPAQVFRQA